MSPRVVLGILATAAALGVVGPAAGGDAAPDATLRAQARVAVRAGGATLAGAHRLAGQDISLTCFEGRLRTVINAGCFQVPSGGGDCVSRGSHFFVQYIFPDLATPHRIRGFAFLSNDGGTVFPSAGAVLMPAASLRFPTPSELASLQVRNVVTPHDTAIVVVDLQAQNLVFQQGTAVALCLQFPEGGRLSAVGSGPGIAADDTIPDQTCDYFTVSSGQTGSWFIPDPDDPEPLDWGFELIAEPVTAAEAATWTLVKRRYRDPVAADARRRP